MKKIITNLIFIFIFSCIAYAQQKGANISFENETHDFGKIDEAGGTVTHKFVFTNTGSTPLVISNVKASCGCTTSDWTKSPVQPGEKGFVAATYNPRGRPGKFKKSISVTSNAETSVAVIYIAGEVIAKQRTIQDDYPRQIGPIRLVTNQFSFTKVMKGEIKEQQLKILNDSRETVTIGFDKVPNHITLKAIPEQLEPNEEGVIVGFYDSNKKDDWGFAYDRVFLITNGELASGNLTISATIAEDFSNLTVEELQNAARIQFKEETFDFGTIKQNTKIEHNFEFTNTGKSDLIIRNIKATCGCTTVAPDKKLIHPGETSSIKAIFSAGNRRGRQNKPITIVTNDPISSTLTIKLSGSVEEPVSK